MRVGVYAARLGAADTDLLLRNYVVAGPIIERLLGPIPFVWTTMPAGLMGPTIYHGPLSPQTRPKAAVVKVHAASGDHVYPQLSASRIEGLVRYGAVEIHSWSPTAADPARVGFARLVVSTASGAPQGTLSKALLAMRDVLAETGVHSVLLFDGGIGATLWIPFANGPAYDDVRAWLHQRCTIAVDRYPELLTLEPNTHVSPRAHLRVGTNAVGRFSAVPYSARGSKGYPLAIPVPWECVETFENGSVGAGELAAWIERNGEAFGREVAAIGAQAFAEKDAPFDRLGVIQQLGVKTHGAIIGAAVEVLQDGRSHTAEDILALALQRGLLDAKVTHKYVYTALIEYIARANGNGRKPAIVQNADRSFRVNEPLDEWPVVDEEPAAPVSAEIEALIARLNATAAGGDFAAFEQAVCDAFDALGFSAMHVGGQKAPDGYADALLGPLGYRTMIECKSADEGVNDPSIFEAAKYRDGFGAQFCALVARAFSAEIEVTKELQNHGVSAFTVEDLQTLLRIKANPLEMKPLFAPGFAADALDDLLWERPHGRAKRVRLVADAIVRTGWTTQAAYRGSPADAPRLTEDVAMVLVDQDLAAQGSGAACSRDDVRAAIAFLSNPLVRLVEYDPDDGSVVVLTDANVASRPSTSSG